MTDLNFLALDLEMNSFEGTHEQGKIIQVGIVIGNFKTYTNQENYLEKSWYVDPYEAISPRITQLTGITDDDVSNHSTPFETIQNEISNLMHEYNCNPNPVVWGGGDANLFKKEARENVGYCKVFGHREIDVKTIFTFFQLAHDKSTKCALKSALHAYRLQFQGTPHRAMDDARNTLNLFFEMITKEKAIYNLLNQIKEIK